MTTVSIMIWRKVYKRNLILSYMQVKLLHDLIEEMAGENTGRIVEILFGKKDVNEFSIAKKMDLTINQVRNILYKLSAEGLVSFIRKKDKRKGWYIYYWTLQTEKCLIKLEDSLLKKIETLKHTLQNRETKRFYICDSCGIEVNEEKALEHGFSCEECAEVYALSNNSGPIRDMKAKITRIENSLSLIQNELKIVREKQNKKRARDQKKTEKEDAKKKALVKTARAAAKKKLSVKKQTVTKKSATKKIKKAPKKAVKKVTKGKPVKNKVKKKLGFASIIKKKLSKGGK
jgi:transcription factor E